MNRPQRFRGLATDPGVQRKTPRTVTQRENKPKGPKIVASQVSDSIRANLASLVELTADYVFLFNNVQQLVLKVNDDLVALIKVRISKHQKAEEEKAEATRKRIREEELQRIANEAKPMTYRAEVTNLEALVHAVAGGLAPLSVLTVNWDAFDALVAQQGSLFSMAGVTLVNAAA